MIPVDPSGSVRASSRTKPILFIGSSGEALARGIVDRLTDGLRDLFTVKPWNQAFPDGGITIQTLIQLASEVDAAVLVFADDDLTESKGQSRSVTRDNVLLEYGVFLSAVGLSRVSVVCESNVSIPTDVHGVTVNVFQSDGQRRSVSDDTGLAAEIDRCMARVAERWKDLQPLTRPGPRRFLDGGTAVAATLEHANSRISEIAAALEGYARTRVSQTKRPITFDSKRLCLRAYKDGLAAVRERFWTTTFLTSEFWVKGDTKEVMAANEEMLQRIKPDGGTSRRLFLLQESPSREVDLMKERVIHLRRIGPSDEIDQLRGRLLILSNNVRQLAELGCELRVAVDRDALHRLLSIEPFDPRDSEIALYDDFRLDVFGGGYFGAISQVRAFTPATHNFTALRRDAVRYFEGLWKTADPAVEFIDLLQRALDLAEKRIEHPSNWLLQYEFLLEQEDRRLKDEEFEALKTTLKNFDRWGSLRSYLDIGSCTGRYPYGLRDAVSRQGSILGIDVEVDCIRFAQNHPSFPHPDPRISFKQMDFTAEDFGPLGRFDLITCMMSTFSHFGSDKNLRHDDTLQGVLERVGGLLEPGGLFVFTLYSHEACAKSDLLKIYHPSDAKRLAEWTPRSDEIRKRLHAAGLSLIASPSPSLRMDMYICQLAN